VQESIKDVLKTHLLEVKYPSAPPLPDWVKDKSESARVWVRKMMMSDPLIAEYYLAKTDAERKKALDTYKSIRAGSGDIRKVVKARELIIAGKMG
jgi:hypothetical protein